MSKENRQRSFDPGGHHEGLSLPSLEWDRITGHHSYEDQVMTDDTLSTPSLLSDSGRLDVGNGKPRTPGQGLNAPSRDDGGTLSGTKKPDDAITIDSGYSINSGEGVSECKLIPRSSAAESTLVSEPFTSSLAPTLHDCTPTLPFDNDSGIERSSEFALQPLALLSSDPGYASLQSIDYSSFGSSINSDLGSSINSESVIRRSKPKQFGVRLSSETLNVNRGHVLLHNKSGSWHEDSPEKKLQTYARKMNYSEMEFQQCLSELGGQAKDIDSDKLLRHLVKIRESNRQAVPQNPPNSKTRLTSSKSSSHLRSEPDSGGLRRIVIDGSNVAMQHGNHQIYSCRGIEIVVNYFKARGHEHITVFVPAHRLQTEHRETKDQHILNGLSRRGVVVKTPSRKSSKGNIASYEDRFILKLASMEEAIVVSNDHFRDLKGESSAFRETIEKRILPFVFANDQFIPAEDPLGKRGPTLEQFLRVDPYNTSSGVCPYGRKCTYGTKCKFGHPEREESYDSALGDSVKYMSNNSVSGESLSSRALHSDNWNSTAGRSTAFDSYAAQTGSPATHYQLATNVYRYNTVNNPASAMSQPVSSNPPPTFYHPNDNNANLHFQGRSAAGFSADYPLARHAYQPRPASRAHMHMNNNESYYSVPLDDSSQSGRHRESLRSVPLLEDSSLSGRHRESLRSVPLLEDSSLSGRHHGKFMPLMAVHMLPSGSDVTSRSLSGPQSGEPHHSSEMDPSSTPQPLNENISSSSQYPTYVLPGRVPAQQYHQPQQHGRHDAPIPKDDPRYHMYFHLTNLFSEKVVRRVMNRLPHEKDPNKITAAVLELQARTKDC